MLKQLCDVCGQLSNDESLGVVVLTGGRTASGKSPSFVGGADIKEMHAITSSLEAKIFITQIHNACQALRDLPVPVIARVNGFALGAGLEIMAACDLRIATQNSIFGMPEVKIGLPSVVEAALLPGLIGMGRARRLMYLAENISAEIAEGWGLIERVVTDEAALNEAIDEWSATIAGMGPKAMTTQKRLMQEWERSFTPNSIMAGIHAFERTYVVDESNSKLSSLIGISSTDLTMVAVSLKSSCRHFWIEDGDFFALSARIERNTNTTGA